MRAQQWSIALLRIIIGWFLLADGILALSNPGWSAAYLLKNAQTFPQFYAWLAQPHNLVWVNPLNEWGIFLIGLALVLGIAVRPAAWLGAVLMILYYLPQHAFPFYLQYGIFVEEHIIDAAALVVLALSPYTEFFGLGGWAHNTVLGRIPILRWLW